MKLIISFLNSVVRFAHQSKNKLLVFTKIWQKGLFAELHEIFQLNTCNYYTILTDVL